MKMVFFTPAADVLIFSVLIVTTINIFYKILVNQKDAKASKDRIKELNARIKELSKSGDKKQSEGLFKEVMAENSRIMRMSLKPMIISFVIVLVSLPWVSSVYGEKIVEIKDGKGEFQFNGNTYAAAKNENTITMGGGNCQMPCSLKEGKYTFSIEKAGSGVKFSPVIAVLPFSAPFVGSELGWLGWYFLLSIMIMVVTRKFMKINV